MAKNWTVGSGWSDEEDSAEMDNYMSQLKDNGCHKAKDPVPIFPYTFHDVPVHFPYKAYSSQQELMANVIEGVRMYRNCLLESPTGTGKTAAILSPLLAWIDWISKNRNVATEDNNKAAALLGPCTCGLYPEEYSPDEIKVVFLDKKVLQSTLIQAQHDEESPTKKRKTNDETETEDPPRPLGRKTVYELCPHCRRKHLQSLTPKIYYATRTHSQIKQVVKQLKALPKPYCDVKMTILGSRAHTCIYEDAKNKNYEEANGPSTDLIPNDNINKLNSNCTTLRKNFFRIKQLKNEMLERSLKESEEKELGKETCPFFKEPKVITQKFQRLQATGAWDIEELVDYGKNCDSCPYYGSRGLHETAEIILCPYNYILDPGLHGGLNLDLENNIVVFDEAHNIEGFCCDMASSSFNLERIDNVRTIAFDAPLVAGIEMEVEQAQGIRHFSTCLQKLSTWIRSKSVNVDDPVSFTEPSDIIRELTAAGFGPNTMRMHREHVLNLSDPDMEDPDESVEEKEDGDTTKSSQSQIPPTQPKTSTVQKKFKISRNGFRFVKKLLSTLQSIYGNEEDPGRLSHYAVALSNTGKEIKSSASVSGQCNAARKSTPAKNYNIQLDILCLSPAVAFKPVLKARTIIVASGTLSPVESFSGELETPFPIILTASHVIKNDQIWTGVIESAPDGKTQFELNKIGQNIPQTRIEVGNAILNLCQIVPFGMLVFLSSYGFLERLHSSWSAVRNGSSILQKIGELKKIYIEKKSGDAEAFKKDIEEFKTNAVVGNGAILFAVFRGKVSEGIDFKDDEARAVVTVGIPYSYMASPEVQNKQIYNDKRKAAERNSKYKLLSGREWYEAQAFRTINQGFGRCIRHIQDWGAIIMIESRMKNYSKQKQISKWVRDGLKSFEKFEMAEASLEVFFENQLEKMAEASQNKRLVQERNLDTTMESVNEEDFDMSFEEPQPSQSTSRSFMNMTTQRLPLSSPRLSRSQAETLPLPLNNVDVVLDSDSSSYSLDEDSGDEVMNTQSPAGLTFEDLPTQRIIPQHQQNVSSDDDISYHSDGGDSDILLATQE